MRRTIPQLIENIGSRIRLSPPFLSFECVMKLFLITIAEICFANHNQEVESTILTRSGKIDIRKFEFKWPTGHQPQAPKDLGSDHLSLLWRRVVLDDGMHNGHSPSSMLHQLD
jgi:hypothetical protein